MSLPLGHLSYWANVLGHLSWSKFDWCKCHSIFYNLQFQIMYEGPCSAYSTPRDDLVIYVSCLVLTALIYVLLSYEQSRQAILVLLSIFLSHYRSTVCYTISWLNLLLLVLISRKILDLCFWLQCIPAFHLEYNQILGSLQTLQTCSKVIASLEVQAPQVVFFFDFEHRTQTNFLV